MKKQSETVAENRALTPAEFQFLEWILRNGGPRSESLLPQLSRAWVTGRCGCGCASINLSVDGTSHCGESEIEPVCEYQWQSNDGAKFGVFAFACGGLLAGIDLWSIDGHAPVTKLPAVSVLQLCA